MLTILKRTPIHCVVSITGVSASETIVLATTLLHTNETPEIPLVNISALTWSIPSGNATITRNSVPLWTLTGSDELEFLGWSDNTENDSDIVITLPAGGGTVIIELLKIGGYGNEQHRNSLGGP